MRTTGLMAGVAILAVLPGAASAQTGASAGVPAQAGSAWGHGGGATSVPMTAPTPAATYAPGANYTPGAAPATYAPPPASYTSGPVMTSRGGYRRLDRGAHLPRRYRDESLVVRDWRSWGFSPPGPGMAWLRYNDDAVLVDNGDRIVDVRYGVDWDHGYRGRAYAGRPGPGYGSRPGAYPPPGYGYPAPGVSSYQAGPNTVVTTAVTPLGAPGIYPAGGGYGYGYGYGGGTVVSVTPGMAVTTTTTTTDYETIYRSVGRRSYHRVRHYHPRCVRVTCPVQGS